MIKEKKDFFKKKKIINLICKIFKFHKIAENLQESESTKIKTSNILNLKINSEIIIKLIKIIYNIIERIIA